MKIIKSANRLLFLCLLLISVSKVVSFKIHSSNGISNRLTRSINMSLGNDGSIGETKIPRPNIITPSEGTKSAIEKFLMMYTCKKCEGRNAQMVAKVAYNYGMVISTCKHCKVKHLIADNQGKLDMPEYGKKIEDYLTAKGEVVQKVAIRGEDLEDNYLVDCDGVVSLVPKIAGQPSPDVNIIDLKPPKAPSRGFGSQ